MGIQFEKQQRVVNLLESGQEFSTIQLCELAKVADPRGIIRDLRKKGYMIVDRWAVDEYGQGYKFYRMENGSDNN